MTQKALLVVTLVLAACGAPPADVEPVVPVDIMRGDYWLDFFAGASEGTCDFIPETILTTLAFDEAGNVKSPLDGVVTCVTTYPDGFVSFTCKGLGNTLTARARGYSSKDGVVESAYGDGLITGNVRGCTRMVFGFGIKRPE